MIRYQRSALPKAKLLQRNIDWQQATGVFGSRRLVAPWLPLFSAPPMAGGKVQSPTIEPISDIQQRRPETKPFLEHPVSGENGDGCNREDAIARFAISEFETTPRDGP
jgi:hypothetical protein